MTIKRTAALLATTGIAVLAVLGATAAAASSAPSGTEHWLAENTNPESNTATLIVRGPLTNGGTINLQTGHVKLVGGTLNVSHRALHSVETVNARTCLGTVTASGTYKITGGTGAFRHVTGHGRYSVLVYSFFKRVKGKCAEDVVPYASTVLFTATGPLTG